MLVMGTGLYIHHLLILSLSLHNSEGRVFLRYTEEARFKTNKGGLKHQKVQPKVVDVYPIPGITLSGWF